MSLDLCCFRDYLHLVEISKRSGSEVDKMVRDKASKLLTLLSYDRQELSHIQKQIVNSLNRNIQLLEIKSCTSTMILSLVNRRTDIRTMFFNEIVSLARKINIPESDEEHVMDKVSGWLRDVVCQCDKEVSKELLRKVEASIDVEFYKDELRNQLIVKLRDKVETQ